MKTVFMLGLLFILSCLSELFFVSVSFAQKSPFCLGGKECFSGLKTLKSTRPKGDYSILGLELEHSVLGDVIEKFNGGTIVKSGDAGTSLSRVCYKGEDGTYASFESTEMGGTNKTLMEFTVSNDENYVKRFGTCNGSSKINAGIATDSGLKLGLGINELKKQLGPPSKKSKNVVIYHFENPVTIKIRGEDFIESWTLVFRFRRNKVNTLSVSKLTSN